MISYSAIRKNTWKWKQTKIEFVGKWKWNSKNLYFQLNWCGFSWLSKFVFFLVLFDDKIFFQATFSVGIPSSILPIGVMVWIRIESARHRHGYSWDSILALNVWCTVFTAQFSTSEKTSIKIIQKSAWSATAYDLKLLFWFFRVFQCDE